MTSFDLHYYPLNISRSSDLGELAGGLAAAAPRTANRLRRDDLIAMLLTIRGNKDAEDKEILKITRQLAAIFFQTLGSVTRAMSAVAEEINRILMDYNLDAAHEGQQLEGMLNLAVIHKGALFICHCGPTQTLVLHSDSVDVFGQNLDVKTMGANRTVQVQFFQSALYPGNILAFSANPPYSWTPSNLNGSSYLAMEQVRRRLLNQAGEDLQAVVVKINPGQGKIQLGEWGALVAEKQQSDQDLNLRPLRGSSVVAVDADETTGQLQPEAESVMGGGSVFDMNRDLARRSQGEFQAETVLNPRLEKKDDLGSVEEEPLPIQPGRTESSTPDWSLRDETQTGSRFAPGNFISNLRYRVKALLGRLPTNLGKFFQRSQPQQEHKPFLSPTYKTFLLILIPLVLIGVSLTIYSRSGRQEQYSAYLDLAQQYQILAGMENDPFRQYDYWKKSLVNVIKAEEYGAGSTATSLHDIAQKTIDSLDLSKRLEFRPALTSKLPENINIQKVVPSGSDVYLLDGNSGSILRIAFNNKGYFELDPRFKCAPGPSGLNTIGPLIDLAALPANQPDNYRVMGMDADGNLLYCVAEGTPSSQRVPAPAGGWGKIAGFALDQSNLYILDVDKKTVWMYPGSGINYVVSPHPFFDDDIPDLGGAIDLAVDAGELYVLNADGHMITCQYGENKTLKKTACKDPTPYTDARLGHEKSPWIFMDSHFIAMQPTHLANSSIYILDDANRAVFQMSYQLNLEATLKVLASRTYPIPSQAPTAFGISTSRFIFLAFGSQLYFANLP
jgi:hypothetical protein